MNDLILEVARETVQAWPDLALGTSTARPKAWGALAAKGVATLRDRLGRPLTEDERRMLWAALWQAAQEPRT